MIVPSALYGFLQEKGITFYTGVPDSLIKSFLSYVSDHSKGDQHIITANEGLAIGLASGYSFSTGQLPLVYLQNSGLGNIINPLTSLADKEMYSVPMILLIGWRGRPGVKDEPQHIKMGRITPAVLEALEIPFYVLEEKEEITFGLVAQAIDQAIGEERPVALLVPEGIFQQYESKPVPSLYSLEREEVITKLVAHLKGDETIICTTGKIGREFYEQNERAGKKISRYLLCAGAMGHASHIALGIQLNTKARTIMLDGDGALLMQMGALPTLAHYANGNYIHIVINNGSHESVGGQPTEAFAADLCGIASASGYPNVILITNEQELEDWFAGEPFTKGNLFVEIRTNKKSRPDLGRPPGQPIDWKKNLVEALAKRK